MEEDRKNEQNDSNENNDQHDVDVIFKYHTFSKEESQEHHGTDKDK